MNEPPEEFRPSQISEARRRRRSYGFVPTTKGDRAVFITQLAERLVANADFYLFSFLCGVVLAIAILLDNPAIYVLAALLAPFMAPVVGLGFATVVGSLRFFLQSLGSFLIGSLLVFLTGALGGWVGKLFPNLQLTQAHYHVSFSIPDFLLLTIGIVLALYLTVKTPKNRSLVASVALAYEIYIPIGLAGFGLTSKIGGLFPQGLEMVGIWLAWVIFVGTVFLAVLKLRPTTFFGYLLTAVILAGAVYTLLSNGAFGTALKNQLQAKGSVPTYAAFTGPTSTRSSGVVVFEETETPTPLSSAATVITGGAVPTNTIAPTNTPTQTITPKPTPIYAQVHSITNESVWLHKTPTLNGDYLILIPINTLVQILTTQEVDGRTWVQIIVTETGQQGLMLQSLVQTATPVPNW